MIIITKLFFSMKHGSITIYIIYFLNRGIHIGTYTSTHQQGIYSQFL